MLVPRVISPSQGLYLHRTTQTRKNIHALNGIRTHDRSAQNIKAHAPDCVAIVTDLSQLLIGNYAREDSMHVNRSRLLNSPKTEILVEVGAGIWVAAATPARRTRM
jgi:hypothetical protein